MKCPSIHLDPGSASRCALRLSLEPASGRWRERILLASNDIDEPIVIESVVDDDVRWPLSPPWQEAVSEKHGDECVLMAIGRAGRSHWSGSWRIVHETAGDGIEAEIACRLHERPAFLGSTFRVGGRSEIVSESGDRLAIVAENATITFHTDPRGAILKKKTGESLFSIQPIQVSSPRFPDTVSYRYRMVAQGNK